MDDKLRILVVEDERGIRDGVCDVAAYHGYDPVGIETGEDGLREALAQDYALLLLDVMLPGMSGFDVCKAVRQEKPKQPIIMLTAKGSEEDVLTGFRCGADDYVTKPFSVRELVMRMEALLRRSGKLQQTSTFIFGSWSIDPENLTGKYDAVCIELSTRECGIMALLHEERGRIVSRRRLLHEVWGFDNAEDLQTRTVDMHIAKLRKKIDANEESLIETVRGAGYRYTGP